MGLYGVWKEILETAESAFEFWLIFGLGQKVNS